MGYDGVDGVQKVQAVNVSNGELNLELQGNDITFVAIPSGHNERMRVASSGNVGIGVTSPASILDVDGTIRTRDLTILGGADLAEPFEAGMSGSRAA